MKHLIFLLLPIFANAQGYRPKAAPLALSFAAYSIGNKITFNWIYKK